MTKAAANNQPIPDGAFYQVPRALPFKIVLVTESEDWRQLIIDCLNNVYHAEDEAATTRMIARARSYVLIDGTLYKKGVVQPLLKCISQTEVRDLLQEIHSGICGSHIGPRALSAKAIGKDSTSLRTLKTQNKSSSWHAKVHHTINQSLRHQHR